MARRVLGMVVAAFVAAGLAAAAWWGWIHRPADAFLLAGFLAGLIFPFAAVVRLFTEARRDPPLRPRLAVLVGLGAAASAVLAWQGRGDLLHFLFAMLGVAAVGLAGLVTLLMEYAGRSARRHGDSTSPVVIWGWGAVLFGSLLCLSYPGGLFVHGMEVRAAKAWVERAAVEVRAAVAADGRPPASLSGLLPRLPHPPRMVPWHGGYSVSKDGASFEFTFDAPTEGLFGGVWIYDGMSGKWNHWTD